MINNAFLRATLFMLFAQGVLVAEDVYFEYSDSTEGRFATCFSYDEKDGEVHASYFIEGYFNMAASTSTTTMSWSPGSSPAMEEGVEFVRSFSFLDRVYQSIERKKSSMVEQIEQVSNKMPASAYEKIGDGYELSRTKVYAHYKLPGVYSIVSTVPGEIDRFRIASVSIQQTVKATSEKLDSTSMHSVVPLHGDLAVKLALTAFSGMDQPVKDSDSLKATIEKLSDLFSGSPGPLAIRAAEFDLE